MTNDNVVFFQNVIAAGAILAGFCGTFLVFRIQREAQYYRQPALSYEEEDATDVYVGRSHFTSSFLLIITATITSVVFGFLMPLFALAGSSGGWITPDVVVAGLVAASVTLAGYFCDELVHYEVISNHLLNDAREWGLEMPIVLVTLGIAIIAAVTGLVVVK